MKILFLDDSTVRATKFRSMAPNAEIVSTATECIEKLRSDTWDWVFLDHDLGGETFVDSNHEDCGMEVVRNIVEEKLSYHPIIIVHSLNADARKHMCLDLIGAGYDARSVPFTILRRYMDELS